MYKVDILQIPLFVSFAFHRLIYSTFETQYCCISCFHYCINVFHYAVCWTCIEWHCPWIKGTWSTGRIWILWFWSEVWSNCRYTLGYKKCNKFVAKHIHSVLDTSRISCFLLSDAFTASCRILSKKRGSLQNEKQISKGESRLFNIYDALGYLSACLPDSISRFLIFSFPTTPVTILFFCCLSSFLNEDS